MIIPSIFISYFFIGFIAWVFSDPFDIFPDRKIVNDADAIELCIQKGGIPIKSGWTDLMKECKFSSLIP